MMFRSASRLPLVGALLCCLLGAGLQAGGGPENVLVVVNAESWSSRAVANEYMARRAIPATNRLELEDIGIRDTIVVEDFRQKILLPVLRYIEQNMLASQIDIIAYSADFPYRVDFSADAEGRMLPKQLGTMGSLTGLTFHYQAVMLKQVDYLDLNANRYALALFRRDADPPWPKSDRALYGKVHEFFLEQRARKAKAWGEADEAWLKDNWRESVATLRLLAERHPEAVEVSYNLACGLAVLGQADEAMAELTRTVELGWANQAIAMAARNGWLDYTDMAKDEDFASLREREDFQRLLERVAAYQVSMPQSRSFDASTGWTVDGRRCPPYQGARYFLSTMLGFTGGRGNSYGEVVGYLQRAAAADGTRPEGTVYFMANDDVRSTTRQWAVSGAVERLRESGVRAVAEPGVLPKERPDVAGLMTGTASFDWSASGSTILPGAICEHLTSFGGVLDEEGSQTPLSAFLAAGAAGASGTVVEPYAIQGKFPNAFLHACYAEGGSLAEAFYQSVTGPYQLLVVGDPLCQPWAQPPRLRVEGLEPNQVVKGSVPIKLMTDETGPKAGILHLFLDGRRFAVTPPNGEFNLPTDKLSDGHHELRVVALAADPSQAQSRLVIPFLVANRQAEFNLLGLPGREIRYGERLVFEADVPGATRVDVFLGARRIAGISSAKGAIQVDTVDLGMGPVELRCAAVLAEGDGRISGIPLVFPVLPPPRLSLPEAQLPKRTEPGFQLLVGKEEEKTDATVEELKDDWLERNGAGEGTSFAARGYFEAPAEGLYQFQFQGNLLDSCRVKVDDELQAIPPGDGWRAMPVFLAKGTHSLTLLGRGAERPRLEVRFGGPGCRTADAKRFHRGLPE
ncbi:MAG: hypothetical protein RBU25_19255 [Lentisphaeria bacterium]|nr:hypothetical protein [Lentisphaeria bacterium]